METAPIKRPINLILNLGWEIKQSSENHGKTNNTKYQIGRVYITVIIQEDIYIYFGYIKNKRGCQGGQLALEKFY